MVCGQLLSARNTGQRLSIHTRVRIKNIPILYKVHVSIGKLLVEACHSEARSCAAIQTISPTETQRCSYARNRLLSSSSGGIVKFVKQRPLVDHAVKPRTIIEKIA